MSARLALLALAAAWQAQAVTPADRPLFDGVTYRQERRGDPAADPMVIHIVTLDLTRPGLRLGVTPPDRSRGMEYVAHTVRDALIANHAQVAVNASYFLPFFGGSPKGDDYYPHAGEPVSVSGAAMGGGRVASPVEIDQDLRVSAILCIGRRTDIRAGQRCPAGTRDAIAAGPHLLQGGQPVPLHRALIAEGGKGPRTAFGLSTDRRRAWILVVDGRQKGYSMGADNGTLVALFRELGASDAMSFDGGGSSTLAVAEATGPVVLNRPIHTGVPGRERPVANELLVFATPLSPTKK
ncbi:MULTISPECIES: phosphodiester glycosidase family protein [Sphingomonas]|uniref:phosphodiester glycosidase family protein n=1 Tax=Sphingomonas TaxID=13687 RepID=UPI000831B8C6|nr:MULTISPECIES: phosphodiester glycosidase family protein [Sphingomonas]MBY0302662.1 phosphodiester glycosidase family protein [Sphingomonas ginsenosidimutans]